MSLESRLKRVIFCQTRPFIGVWINLFSNCAWFSFGHTASSSPPPLPVLLCATACSVCLQKISSDLKQSWMHISKKLLTNKLTWAMPVLRSASCRSLGMYYYIPSHPLPWLAASWRTDRYFPLAVLHSGISCHTAEDSARGWCHACHNLPDLK